MKVKVKRSGTIFIALTLLMGGAAANTGNNLLYMIVSAMLSLMLLSGVISIYNLRGLQLRLIPPDEIFAGRKTRFKILLKKEGPLPSFLIKISSKTDQVLLSKVFKDWVEAYIYLYFEKRGKVSKVTLEVSSDFPLGMFVRSTEVEVNTNFIVFPTPLETRLKVLSDRTQTNEQKGDRKNKRGYEDTVGLRDYFNDPLKLIHWKVSAKREKLTVKETVEISDSPVILSLDLVPGDVEEKLSRLSYLALKLSEKGIPVGLELGSVSIKPALGKAHLRKILTELALFSVNEVVKDQA